MQYIFSPTVSVFSAKRIISPLLAMHRQVLALKYTFPGVQLVLVFQMT